MTNHDFSQFFTFLVTRIIHRVILLTTKWHIVGLLFVHKFNRFGSSNPTIISPTEFQTSSCTYNHRTFLSALDIQVRVITVCGGFPLTLCCVPCLAKSGYNFLRQEFGIFDIPWNISCLEFSTSCLHVQYTTINNVTIVLFVC